MRVLFLHGGGLTKAMWRPQLDALASDFDVDALDLPGHGERAAEKFSFPAALDVVAAALPDDERSVLVGLSLGGYVSILLSRDRPQLAAGLVLSGCCVDYSRGGQRVVAVAGEGFQRVWPKRLLRNAQSAAFKRDYEPWADEIVESGSYWRGYADALHAVRKIHWHGALRSYGGQVLVLNGERDRPHVNAQPQFLEDVRHGRAELVKGAAHLANLDRPDEYSEAVARFVRLLG